VSSAYDGKQRHRMLWCSSSLRKGTLVTSLSSD